MLSNACEDSSAHSNGSQQHSIKHIYHIYFLERLSYKDGLFFPPSKYIQLFKCIQYLSIFPPLSQPPEPVDAIAVRPAALSRASVQKRIQPPTSMFEDAGLVLRQVRQSKKILEENLEAILRAKDGEVLHTQLEALSKNRYLQKTIL